MAYKRDHLGNAVAVAVMGPSLSLFLNIAYGLKIETPLLEVLKHPESVGYKTADTVVTVLGNLSLVLFLSHFLIGALMCYAARTAVRGAEDRVGADFGTVPNVLKVLTSFGVRNKQKAEPDPHQRATERLLEIAELFCRSAGNLRYRLHGPPPYSIENEFDVREFLRNLIRREFRDVRIEEPTPKNAQAQLRRDLGVPPAEAVFLTKFVRDADYAQHLEDELRADFENFHVSSRYKTVIVLIYDPQHYIKDPYPLLRMSGTRVADGHSVRVHIVISPPVTLDSYAVRPSSKSQTESSVHAQGRESRRPDTGLAPEGSTQTKATEERRVLVLAANPTNLPRLRTDRERKEIGRHLKLANERNRFPLHERDCVTREDLSGALLDTRPWLAHISGHSTEEGDLYVEDETGSSFAVSREALAELFARFVTYVHCVVLNTCYSENHARAIASRIPYVIGMRGTITDKSAIAFSVGFYQAFFEGETIENAWELGRIQIRMASPDTEDYLQPLLFKDGKEMLPGGVE